MDCGQREAIDGDHRGLKPSPSSDDAKVKRSYVLGISDNTSADWLQDSSRKMGEFFNETNSEIMEPHFTLIHIDKSIAKEEDLASKTASVVSGMEMFPVSCKQLYHHGNKTRKECWYGI